VEILIEHGALPESLRHGDYGEDPAFRSAVQSWLDSRWRRKDALLTGAETLEATGA
jgi:hypothetical protein